MAILTRLCLLLSFLALSLAEPAQFCKFRQSSNQADFCTGFTVHHNASTGAHNVYLTFSHSRPANSAKGWTAVGFGEEMTGSLMVIVYGDPASGKSPIVSVRASTGHTQPTLVTPGSLGGGDLRVLRSDWISDDSASGTVTALVSLVCYSCTLWPGTSISATSTSQPFIWAWNANQEFSVFSYDAHLLMHKHHAGNGGWGRFYVDMAGATSKVPQLPSVPYIRPGVTAHGASEDPDIFAEGAVTGLVSWAKKNPVLHIHGALMAAAFLFLFPAGVFTMRSGSSKSFKYHWIIQVLAALAVLGGMTVGLTLQKKINTAHQIVGLSIVGILFLQAYMGYKHHIDFVRIHRRTWISHSHIWTGRVVMVGGCGNLILGMRMRGYSRLMTSLAAAFMVMQGVALIFWVWRQNKVAARRNKLSSEESQWTGNQNQEYFTVASESDDEESESEDKEKDAEQDS